MLVQRAARRYNYQSSMYSQSIHAFCTDLYSLLAIMIVIIIIIVTILRRVTSMFVGAFCSYLCVNKTVTILVHVI